MEAHHHTVTANIHPSTLTPLPRIQLPPLSASSTIGYSVPHQRARNFHAHS
jgi:hypothetical protein